MAKILVIDDEAELLEMMRLVLERRGGHQTVLCAEGADGLAEALANPPDMAIIDVMMPGITGYEICRQLRANPSTASTPIIILTARAQPMDRDAALNAGADAYITKPVMMEELLEQINGLLAERVAAESLSAGAIVLMSLRGGVGVTTLAVNLAATLSQVEGGTICLVDLCPSSGHVALQLGLRPEPNWSGLVRAPDAQSLDAEAVEAHLLQHSSGLRVLASPFFPVVGQGMSQQVLQAMLRTLQQQFTTVVVDAPAVLNEVTMDTLEVASAVGLVVTAEPPSIQTTVGTLRVLNQWSDKFHIILNQIAPGSQPPTEAIERTLKRSLVGSVPFDPAQARALAQRTPLALSSPDGPLAQAVKSLVQPLVQATDG